MKRSYLTLITHVSLVILLMLFLFSKMPVQAANDISVEFPDQPLFTLQNMAPGDSTEKQIHVQNNSATPQQIAVKFKKESGNKNLEDAISLTISEGSKVYKSINMKDAIFQSTGSAGLPPFTLDPQKKSILSMTALFEPHASNSYQGASLTFSMTFQALTGIPSECADIPDLSSPIEGTSKSDRLNGTPGNDLIMGNAGNDIINGKGGRDCILAGLGHDIVNGGAGDDVILGQEGNDLLKGSVGNDIIYGNTGMDILQGEQGDDQLTGDLLDILMGGANRDTCSGSPIKIGCEL